MTLSSQPPLVLESCLHTSQSLLEEVWCFDGILYLSTVSEVLHYHSEADALTLLGNIFNMRCHATVIKD